MHHSVNVPRIIDILQHFGVGKVNQVIGDMYSQNLPLRNVVENGLWGDIGALRAIGGDLLMHKARQYLCFVTDESDHDLANNPRITNIIDHFLQELDDLPVTWRTAFDPLLEHHVGLSFQSLPQPFIAEWTPNTIPLRRPVKQMSLCTGPLVLALQSLMHTSCSCSGSYR
ncbi:hypothetical protein Slin15195_G094300 [Septoria linicola]|uniref:Uncharacterized protein n=1 Tax=Septoria linicola TaxID=215465 RepID=A0A9Q9B4D1_9PEZI|nr:hypothetical protein Slin15195_G094300 [Septoria linicola]